MLARAPYFGERVRALERSLPCEELVEDQPERVQVAAHRRFAAREQLRGHVGRSSGPDPHGTTLAATETRGPEPRVFVPPSRAIQALPMMRSASSARPNR